MQKPLIDLRTYTIALRRIPEFLEVFDRLAMPVQLRHLGPPLGFYVSDIGPLNQVVHAWGYDSLADMEARCLGRNADPDWPAYLEASGHLIVAQENRILRSVPLPSLAGSGRAR
ncbi:NIPSNAP family protein [Azospirillum endophyticum]